MYTEIIDSNKGMKTRIITFNSIAEFVSVKKNKKCQDLWDESVVKRFNGEKGDTPLKQWFDTESFPEFMTILESGKPEYTKLVMDGQMQAPPPQSIRRRKMQGDYGDEVCIHKINTGNLGTAWRRKSPRAKIGVKNIHLLANTGQHCGITAEQAKWVGVACLSIAEALQEAGYNVAVDAIMGAADISDKENIVFVVPLKPYEMPMDIEGLSGALCFPGFFRGAGFMNFGFAHGEIVSWLGTPYTDDSIRRDVIARYFTNPAELVELVSNEVRSKADVQRETTRILASLEARQKQAA